MYSPKQFNLGDIVETKKHKGRTDLIGEHKTGDAGQAVFAVLFLIVYVSDSFIFGFSTFLNEIVPNIIRLAAVNQMEHFQIILPALLMVYAGEW